MKRVQSVFKQRIEKHKEELDEIEAMVRTVEEELPPNILWNCPEGEVLPHPITEGHTYYEQYTIPGPITLRRGDMVYVRSENGKNLIAQIDTMWAAAEDGMAYFHGPWFVTPKETPLAATHAFFKQEALLSTISDSNPLLSIVGKCCVLETKEYTVSRPTQYREPDCFICESVYDESKRAIRGPIEGGLKQYEWAPSVQTDEVFFFKNPIVVQKDSPVSTASFFQKASPVDIDNEDSLDAPPSVGSNDATPSTPAQKKVKGQQKKPVTPYILFSSEIRRTIAEQNKTSSFGEISRIVGEKWRQLADSDKQVYEDKARRINEENTRKWAEEQKAEDDRRRHETATPVRIAASPHGGGLVQQSQMVQPAGGSVGAHYPQGVQQATGQQPGTQGQQQILVARPQLQQQTHHINRPPSQGHPSVPPVVKPVEPIFHTVPPRPQRLLHTEAYIR